MSDPRAGVARKSTWSRVEKRRRQSAADVGAEAERTRETMLLGSSAGLPQAPEDSRHLQVAAALPVVAQARDDVGDLADGVRSRQLRAGIFQRHGQTHALLWRKTPAGRCRLTEEDDRIQPLEVDPIRFGLGIRER